MSINSVRALYLLRRVSLSITEALTIPTHYGSKRKHKTEEGYFHAPLKIDSQSSYIRAQDYLENLNGHLQRAQSAGEMLLHYIRPLARSNNPELTPLLPRRGQHISSWRLAKDSPKRLSSQQNPRLSIQRSKMSNQVSEFIQSFISDSSMGNGRTSYCQFRNHLRRYRLPKRTPLNRKSSLVLDGCVCRITQ